MLWKKVQKFLKENGLTVAIVLGLVIAYAALHTRGDQFASIAELETRLASGEPTVIEFYSNTCSICLIAKPQVDRLERDLAGRATVLRLSVVDSVGRALASRWGVRGLPTFVVVDGAGHPTYAQAGMPDIDALHAAVDALVLEARRP